MITSDPWLILSTAYAALTRAADAPSLQERLFQEALQDGRVATTADYLRIDRDPPLHGASLDACFWRHAKISWDQSSAIRDAVHVMAQPKPYRLPRAEALGIRVSREDMRKVFGALDFSRQQEKTEKTNSDADVQQKTPGMRSASGAKGIIDWEEVLIEAARFMFARVKAGNRIGSQAALFEHLLEWLNHPDGGPSLTSLKEHVGPLWRAFKKIDSG